MVFVARRKKKKKIDKNEDGGKKIIGFDRENKICQKSDDLSRQNFFAEILTNV